MKLTTPKNQSNGIYYVTSESKPTDRHIVVRRGEKFFCDCRDFMIRRLPLLGSIAFQPCKHGSFVRDALNKVRDGVLVSASREPQTVAKKFGIWFIGVAGSLAPFRSVGYS